MSLDSELVDGGPLGARVGIPAPLLRVVTDELALSDLSSTTGKFSLTSELYSKTTTLRPIILLD